MLHELMHKYGMAIPTDSSKRQKYELPIENSMIEIQRVLLQHLTNRVCKGYDVQ
jgi:hypothetical protein